MISPLVIISPLALISPEAVTGPFNFILVVPPLPILTGKSVWLPTTIACPVVWIAFLPYEIKVFASIVPLELILPEAVILPFIPLGHMFYYIGLGLKFTGIKFWKYFIIVMEFFATIIMYVFTPIGRFFAYFGDKFNNWLDSIVIPIKEEKVKKRKFKFKFK